MDKTYNPREFEQRIYENWLNNGYFSAAVNKDKEPFTVMMPPPNITGQLHIGHALDLTIQDAIIRYKRMKGFEALYMPGTDHASIATELKIVEKMRADGLNKDEVGRDGFLRLAFEWNDNYGKRIVGQQKRLGLSCDWSKSAFTMDSARSESVKEVFVNMYNKGLIYRGERIINRCPKCKTALSDAEVEYAPDNSFLWHIKYPIKGESGYIEVATTRPETILGDTAVAVNPKDTRYKKLIGKTLILPILEREIPIIADQYVETDFGSGAVKITPAHDPNDFEIGLRHNLPLIKVISGEGIMNENAGEFSGLDRFDARKKIVQKLENDGFLIKKEPYTHNVGRCYRCKDTVEPHVSHQWFVKMSELARPAIEAVKKGDVSFIPKRFEKIYLHWMNNTRDWCVSRQLWWGHRIPIFYCDSCGKQHALKESAEKCPTCGGKLTQDEDVLDTWFSSALWPFSTLNWPTKSAELDYFYPTNLLVTAYDIIGFWVSRMIFSGLEHTNKPPFSEVLIHGIVRDNEGKKMSKSSNNGVDPLEAIDSAGADALRMSIVSGISIGSDTKYSIDKLSGYRSFMNKIWNAARFVLSNIESGIKIHEIDSLKDLQLFDKWILNRLNNTIKTADSLMNKYEVGLASTTIYDFIWSEFCDYYIEAAKTGLYGGDDKERERVISVLVYVLRESLKLAHPIIPFITAEIFNNLPNKDAPDIMISLYPQKKRSVFPKAAKDAELIMGLIRAVRTLKSEMNGAFKRVDLLLLPSMDKAAIDEGKKVIEKLCLCKSVQIIEKQPDGKFITLVTEAARVFIPSEDLVDTEGETARINESLAMIDAEIKRAEGKLSNQSFTEKAPKAVVDIEREKLEKYKLQRQQLMENLDKLNEYK